MYVGGGDMIDAPQTGQPVKIEPLSSHPYYAWGRSYL
jgi:cell wall-associated NlpC family hydrolase